MRHAVAAMSVVARRWRAAYFVLAVSKVTLAAAEEATRLVSFPFRFFEGLSMAKGNEVFLGLNMQGVILFIVLLLVCFPLCWIPWLVDGMKAARPMK
ncbi:MAG: hypothetical protein WD118_05775 [Phycisphaeraceae bacterium]